MAQASKGDTSKDSSGVTQPATKVGRIWLEPDEDMANELVCSRCGVYKRFPFFSDDSCYYDHDGLSCVFVHTAAEAYAAYKVLQNETAVPAKDTQKNVEEKSSQQSKIEKVLDTKASQPQNGSNVDEGHSKGR